MDFTITSKIFKVRIIMQTTIVLFLFLAFSDIIYAQCKPMIKIDGDATVVNINDDFGLTLPYWLKEGQTLAIGSSVSKISVIEFNIVSGSTLEFSKVINVTSATGVLVPPNTVWKIESIAKLNNSSTYKSITFSTAGTYSWSVPLCAEEICIEIWGAGGGGGGGGYYNNGGGGGGGGFGSGCFVVNPGDSYAINVGAGGVGGTWSNPNGTSGSSGTLSSIAGNGFSITSNAGGGGGGGTSQVGSGGSGGTSNALNNVNGANGIDGGIGGIAGNSSTSGTIYGNGGNGGSQGNPGGVGGKGADGKVIISW